jgi:uncharacterized protein YndB with AHSA1/START domain
MDEVRREAGFEVPVEELWDALVDDERRGEWLGDSQIDVVPGGGGHVDLGDGRRWVRVSEVDPGRRLSFDWWADGEEPSQVTFVVTPEGRGSRLRVIERRPAAAVAEASVAGSMLDLELRFLMVSASV